MVDDGHEFHGSDQVRDWLATAASEFAFTRTLVSAEAIDGDTWFVVNRLEGDFPGGAVDLQVRADPRSHLRARCRSLSRTRAFFVDDQPTHGPPQAIGLNLRKDADDH